MAVGKNITWNKSKRGSNIIFHIILRQLGRVGMGKNINIFKIQLLTDLSYKYKHERNYLLFVGLTWLGKIRLIFIRHI